MTRFEMMPSKKIVRFSLLAVSLSSLFLLSSCGMFFYPNSGGGGGSSCTDCVYIANSGTDDIAQFAVTNPLTVVSSTNVSVAGVIPSSIVIDTSAQYVFVGSVAGGIYSLPINTGGSLGTAVQASTTVGPYAMAVSPDGEWLFTASLDANTTCDFEGDSGAGTPYTVSAFPVDASGVLGTPSVLNFSCGSTTAPPTDLVVSPDGKYLFMAASGVGLAGLTFDEPTGTVTVYSGLSISLNSAVTQVNGVAIDPSSKYLFVASSGTAGGLAQYQIVNSGNAYSLTKIGSTQSPINTFYAVTAPASGTYVYVTARTSGDVYGYSYGSTNLAAISGSPFAPTSASNGTVAIATDSSSKYILTINSTSGPNLQQFSIGTTGALTATSTGTTSSGSWAPVALAVTGSGTT